jgi:hypothetical protein
MENAALEINLKRLRQILAELKELQRPEEIESVSAKSDQYQKIRELRRSGEIVALMTIPKEIREVVDQIEAHGLSLILMPKEGETNAE